MVTVYKARMQLVRKLYGVLPEDRIASDGRMENRNLGKIQALENKTEERTVPNNNNNNNLMKCSLKRPENCFQERSGHGLVSRGQWAREPWRYYTASTRV